MRSLSVPRCCPVWKQRRGIFFSYSKGVTTFPGNRSGCEGRWPGRIWVVAVYARHRIKLVVRLASFPEVKQTCKGESAVERIVCNPEILGGKPVIRGTRIPVYLILDLLSEGYSFEEIIKLYPHLTTEDIKACIKYAAEICRAEEIEGAYGAASNA